MPDPRAGDNGTVSTGDGKTIDGTVSGGDGDIRQHGEQGDCLDNRGPQGDTDADAGDTNPEQESPDKGNMRRGYGCTCPVKEFWRGLSMTTRLVLRIMVSVVTLGMGGMVCRYLHSVFL